MIRIRNLWSFRLYRVSGESMRPTLRPGQLVVVDSKRPPSVGEVVVARRPDDHREIVKRVIEITAAGLWLEGDGMQSATAASSSDSWVFGAVPRDSVVGVVVWPRR